MVDYREPEKTIDYNISESDRFRLDDFELYNLAGRYPNRVETMSRLWDEWEARCLAQTKA